MSDIIAIRIPDLKQQREQRERAAFALLPRAAQAGRSAFRFVRAAAALPALWLVLGSLAGGGAAVKAWRTGPQLDGVHSTIKPHARFGAERLQLVSQATAGSLRWEAPPEETSPSTDWDFVMRSNFGASYAARAKSRSALGQSRAALALSRAGAAQTSLEGASEAAGGAFSQQWRVSGRDAGALLDSLSGATLLSSKPAPDVVAVNATPYQYILDSAYDEAREAGRLGRRAPASFALGAALTATGRAMLSVPGASGVARGILAAGAAAAKKGLEQQTEARRRLARARGLASDLRLLEGQKSQSLLAAACVEALASGASLDRCRGDAPPMTADVKAAVDRELADSPTWEVESGARVAVGQR